MKKIIILIAVISSGITACEKVLEPNPADSGQVVTDVFYSDFNGALQGINGVYASTRDPFKNMWWTDAMSDDGQNSTGGAQEQIDFEMNTVMPNNSVVFSLWASSFSTIYRVNVFLERAPKIPLQGNQAILRDQFVGEAYFLRAFSYFNLVRLYGDVPLLTSELKSTSQLSIPRSPVQEVYAQIEADLLEAIKLLPLKLPNPKLIPPVVNIAGGSEVGRATLGSAKTLLGNLYLLRGDNTKAEQVLREVVSSGVYSLLSTYAANFNALGGAKNNAESVFEIQYAAPATLSGASHDLSYQFGPVEDGNALFRNRPSDNSLAEGIDIYNTLVQAFPTGDLRKNDLVGYSVTAPTRSINRKFYVKAAAQTGSTNWPVYRYSEVILLLAEALQNQGKDAEALVELNKVHASPRTGLTAYVGLTGTALRDAIRLERRLELSLEAKRWFDLQRWGILETTMTAHGRPISATKKGLLPIPQGEIDKNSQFKQNPGY
jgi:starch-binding outer membrane protein, SusD/RagB family